MIIDIVVIVLLVLVMSYTRGILVELQHQSEANEAGIRHLDACLRTKAERFK